MRIKTIVTEYKPEDMGLSIYKYKALELFRFGIKPAVYYTIRESRADEVIVEICNYLIEHKVAHNINWVSGLVSNGIEYRGIVIHDLGLDTNALCTMMKDDTIGNILGFYPPSVENFCNDVISKPVSIDDEKGYYRSGINYNGITFSCTGVEADCLNWCNDTYAEKMLEVYGEYMVRTTYRYYSADTNDLIMIKPHYLYFSKEYPNGLTINLDGNNPVNIEHLRGNSREQYRVQKKN